SMLQSELGKEVSFTVDRKGVVHTITVTPKQDSVTKSYTIGIALEPLETVQLPVHKALWYGLKDAWTITKNVVHALGVLVSGLVTKGGSGLNQFIGPVGLATAVSEASQVGASYFFSFIALISLNLAVLNLVPFPALDGGRLLVLGLEAVTRRKFNKTVVGIIHAVGFGLLILLMIFLTIQDVRHL
ncbi:MAG TPA: M50 family metallopeptidase, partial [Candidatus Paceibacterota bacterium]|nr:M50 family metallopeptidase [Candidatus Paceibacterota bacterium]